MEDQYSGIKKRGRWGRLWKGDREFGNDVGGVGEPWVGETVGIAIWYSIGSLILYTLDFHIEIVVKSKWSEMIRLISSRFNTRLLLFSVHQVRIARQFSLSS